MERTKKTVHKAFDYTNCDDFAHYLEGMAAKGWHFKEWATGLVFEKGIPEKAVYSVEVFIDGNEEDVRPGIHTMNFADYCEAAGWALVDAKRKFCIFKQIRADAVPILTPEERVKNAAKAYSREVWSQLAVSALMLFMLVTNFSMYTNFLTMVFSNANLFSMAACAYCALYGIMRLAAFLCWKHRAKKLARAGEYRVLRNRTQGLFYGVSLITACLLLLVIVARGGYGRLLWIVIWIVIFGGPAWVIARFRPDPDTYKMIQMGAVVVAFLLFAGFSIAILATMNEDIQVSDDVDVPLTYSDLGMNIGQHESVYHTQSSSILGAQERYSLYYNEGYVSLSYTTYRTEKQWILDRIWDHELEAAYNENRTDCTVDWGAEAAFRNDKGGYYVRYAECILILHPEKRTLTAQQIEIVLDLLALR